MKQNQPTSRTINANPSKSTNINKINDDQFCCNRIQTNQSISNKINNIQTETIKFKQNLSTFKQNQQNPNEINQIQIKSTKNNKQTHDNQTKPIKFKPKQ